MNPEISVVIPHKNNFDKLLLCIDALKNQSYNQDLIEIIIIDNGSKNSYFKKLKELSRESNFILQLETISGSYAARNRGLKIAKGEYIAFTDSDCIPNPDWIEKGIYELKKSSNVDIIAGNMKLSFKKDEEPNTFELFEKIYYYKQEINVKNNFAATANIFTRERVIKDVGLFNQNLKSNGDREWCYRAVSKGYKIRYYEDLIINHPARNNFMDFFKRQLRFTGGTFMLKRLNGTSKLEIFLKNLLNIIPPVITIYKQTKKDEFLQINSKSKKIKFILLIIALRYVRVFENFRLLLGFKARSY